MNPILIAPPAIEPVSLAEARTYLKVDTADDDDLIRSLIVASRLMIEAASGRLLIAQTWRLVLDHWPSSGMLRLPLAPISAVVAARVFDPAGLPQVVSPASFAIEAAADPPALWIEALPPQPGRPRAGIELDVAAGYGPTATEVPEPFRLAILALTARWFENRGDVVSHGEATVPADIMALVAPYRRVRL